MAHMAGYDTIHWSKRANEVVVVHDACMTSPIGWALLPGNNANNTNKTAGHGCLPSKLLTRHDMMLAGPRDGLLFACMCDETSSKLRCV